MKTPFDIAMLAQVGARTQDDTRHGGGMGEIEPWKIWVEHKDKYFCVALHDGRTGCSEGPMEAPPSGALVLRLELQP